MDYNGYKFTNDKYYTNVFRCYMSYKYRAELYIGPGTWGRIADYHALLLDRDGNIVYVTSKGPRYEILDELIAEHRKVNA